MTSFKSTFTICSIWSKEQLNFEQMSK